MDKVLSVFKNSHFPDNQWDDLGLKLGITKPKLETIRVDKQDSKDCLKECLSCWLYQNYDTDQYGKPTCTMESLAAALRGMGLTAVAERLDLNTPSTGIVIQIHIIYTLYHYYVVMLKKTIYHTAQNFKGYKFCGLCVSFQNL